MKNLLKFVFVFVFASFLISFNASEIFAEGVTECKGTITGVTLPGNVNTAVTNFDSHLPGGTATDLSIVGKGSGLAPNNREYAGCVQKESGSFGGVNYEYALKGWAWNENLGFVSLSCKNGVNDAGEGSGVSCGSYNYGVFVGAADASGNRDLFGYAWSPSFGWIQFKGQGVDNLGTSFNYGVRIDSQGNASGYAWSESKVWMNFSGINISLDDPVTPPTSCALSGPFSAVICPPAEVTLKIVNTPFAESGGNAIISAELSRPLTSDVTVNLTYSGSATYGFDYTFANQSIFIRRGTTVSDKNVLGRTVSLIGINDSLIEGTEEIYVDINSIVPSSATEIVPESNNFQQVKAEIIDDDQVCTTQDTLSTSQYWMYQNSMTRNVSVNGQNHVVTIYRGSIYNGNTWEVDVDGVRKTISVGQSGVGSDVNFGDVFFRTTSIGGVVTYSINFYLGQYPTCAPEVTLSVDKNNIKESGGGVDSVSTVTATLSTPTYRNVTVNLAYSGSASYGVDYTLSGSSLVIPAGQRSITKTITSIDDSFNEGDESIILDADYITNGTESGIQRVNVKIIDDLEVLRDATLPTVNLTFSQASMPENGGNMQVCAELSKSTNSPVTVTIWGNSLTPSDAIFIPEALFGIDYTVPTAIVVNGGALKGCNTISSVSDSRVEPTEFLTLYITNVVNGTENGNQRVVGSIIDDDGLPPALPAASLQITGSPMRENTGVGKVTVSLSAVSQSPVTVNLGYTGSFSDFQVSSRPANIVIPAGETEKVFDVIPDNDPTSLEPPETMFIDILTVSNGTENGVQRVSATIIDDDGRNNEGYFSGAGDDLRIADGVDGFQIDLYLRDANGQPLQNLVSSGVITQAAWNAFYNSITFNWVDTVKRNQLANSSGNTVGNAFNTVKTPWSVVGGGAVTFKPLRMADFQRDGADISHYYLSSSNFIRSYAPTTDGNVSYTTSVDPSFAFSNETFIYNLGLGTLQPNELILRSISHSSLIGVDGTEIVPVGPSYLNNQADKHFKFKPAIEVDPLFANDHEDKIVAVRNTPVGLEVGTKQNGNLNASNKNVRFELRYDQDASAEGCDGRFDFKFLTDFAGRDLSGVTTVLDLISSRFGNTYNLQAIAMPPSTQGALTPCSVAKAPSLYSVVSYRVGGTDVSYYSNKLPRVGGSQVANPTVVVHGNIYGQAAASISKKVNVQAAGNVVVNSVRDAINENLKKNLGTTPNLSGGGDCKITSLTTVASVSGCAGGYYNFTVGTENVLYFKGRNVSVELNNGDWTNDWVIVSDSGNIFIDGDIYKATNTNDNRISLVAFRDSTRYKITGHIYINPDVKNIQAILVADGSIFSYTGEKDQIDTNGEPEFLNQNERTNLLKSQLLIEGSIFSDNTIGGADLDMETEEHQAKNYLMLGGGEIFTLPVTSEKRMRAQAYDLNYLRLFTLGVQFDGGLPVDQKCGKALTSEDVAAINRKEAVCGEKPLDNTQPPCDLSGGLTQPFACDGIDPFNVYDGSVGDLVPPSDDDATLLAKGLNNQSEFQPVYVYYKAPKKGSFLFSKSGAINIGGK